ncbi:13270_t:CDS:2 [Cetraspora pellucida]|uniref:13270_t:CDS:1 n=1 Tax=Cetraspora pellucida TaxID=1433469 RepID=A0A9N9NPH8_9GLOM|nr:13270_t:CDS:2 [Cetraspora pellucida]
MDKNYSIIKNKSEIKKIEVGDYPQIPTITYQEKKNNIIQRSFSYFIENEGFYPYELCYTLPPKKYPIPNNYSVKTTWRHSVNRKPEFQILYGASFEFEDNSNISASRAATDYEKAVNKSSNKISFLSGPLLFRLQLQKLHTIREFQVKHHIIKLVEQYSQKTLIRRAKEIATTLKQGFGQTSELIYNTQDSISLKSFKCTINNQNYYFDIGNENPIQKQVEILNIIKVMNSSFIS